MSSLNQLREEKEGRKERGKRDREEERGETERERGKETERERGKRDREGKSKCVHVCVSVSKVLL